MCDILLNSQVSTFIVWEITKRFEYQAPEIIKGCFRCWLLEQFYRFRPTSLVHSLLDQSLILPDYLPLPVFSFQRVLVQQLVLKSTNSLATTVKCRDSSISSAVRELSRSGSCLFTCLVLPACPSVSKLPLLPHWLIWLYLCRPFVGTTSF